MGVTERVDEPTEVVELTGLSPAEDECARTDVTEYVDELTESVRLSELPLVEDWMDVRIGANVTGSIDEPTEVVGLTGLSPADDGCVRADVTE